MNYSEFIKKFNISLNPQQETAVKSASGAVLLLAVPGSGKTTVLVARLGYMVYCLGVEPESILTMTYTVAATHDMKKRFSAFFGDEYASRLEFRTINGVSARIIAYYERTLGRKAFELVTDEGETAALIKQLFQKVTGNFAVDGDVKNVRSLITYVKNMMLTEDEIKHLDAENPNFSKIYDEYQKIMLAKKQMDYDDQMVYAYRILKSYPQILAYFKAKYKYLCVDEAQDTSKIQHKIINLLVGEDQKIFMVGDEDQSIYGFRAAYPEALMEFSKTYKNAKVLMLETNYRSTRQIVEKADLFIRKNKHRHLKNMVASHGDGMPIRIIECESRIEQYEKVIDIATKSGECAILYRDNDSAIPLIDLFDRRNISYTARGVDCSFFTHPVVRDILDMIAFVYDDTNPELFLSVYYKFGQGISKELALKAVEICRDDDINPFKALKKYCDLPKWLDFNIQDLIYNFELLARENAFSAFRRIVYYMGYRGYLDSRGADTSKLDILFALAKHIDTLKVLPQRLLQIENLIKNGNKSREDIILSTIHSSKGLEYDRVILIDVIDGLFPKFGISDYSAEDEEVLEEERRLFYVGITRAKNELNIIKYKAIGQESVFAGHFVETKKVTVPETAPKKQNDLKNGDRIMHPKFGKGTINEIKNNIAQINFENYGIKYIDLAVAKIRKED